MMALSGGRAGRCSIRHRLDAELVRRGLVPTRGAAQRAVAAGLVMVDGVVADKAARTVAEAQAVEIRQGAESHVSRAGAKLAGALDTFAIDPAGLRCLDAGASTGGFTDCLLQRGARSVVAVDVGTGQLHPGLVADPRVDSRERTDIRSLRPGAVGGPLDLVVADLSFISLRLVLGTLASLVATGGSLVVLVKPQFEAGRADVARGRGVIRDPAVWRRVLGEVAATARDLGMEPRGASVSVITGAGGNVEFVMWLTAAGTGRKRGDPPIGGPAVATWDGVLDQVVTEAESRMA